MRNGRTSHLPFAFPPASAWLASLVFPSTYKMHRIVPMHRFVSIGPGTPPDPSEIQPLSNPETSSIGPDQTFGFNPEGRSIGSPESTKVDAGSRRSRRRRGNRSSTTPKTTALASCIAQRKRSLRPVDRRRVRKVSPRTRGGEAFRFQGKPTDAWRCDV